MARENLRDLVITRHEKVEEAKRLLNDNPGEKWTADLERRYTSLQKEIDHLSAMAQTVSADNEAQRERARRIDADEQRDAGVDRPRPVLAVRAEHHHDTDHRTQAVDHRSTQAAVVRLRIGLREHRIVLLRAPSGGGNHAGGAGEAVVTDMPSNHGDTLTDRQLWRSRERDLGHRQGAFGFQ